MKVSLLTIGNELLSGVTINTNASWLGQELLEHGFPVTESLTIGDDREQILHSLKYLWESSDILFTTGGLGPTSDDITTEVIAEFFGSELVFHEPTFQRLRQRLSSHHIEITEQHKRQSLVPGDADIIANDSGTAPVIHYARDGKHLFCLPGVPFEMKHLVHFQILPLLSEVKGQHYSTRLIRTSGVPESTIAREIADLVEPLPFGSVAYLPHVFGVDVRLIAEATKENEARLHQVTDNITHRLGQVVYTVADEPLAAVVGRELKQRKFTVSTAESCTGGLLADELTNVSGSSDYFTEGFVTYSNRAKMDRLQVPGDLIEQHGAVSEEVAEAMAKGALQTAGTSTALSTTGIAGPTGGTETKPVGLIYIGCAVQDRVTTKRFVFGKDRRLNKERAVYAALNMLRLELQMETRRQL